jgi:hypothetical protein
MTQDAVPKIMIIFPANNEDIIKHVIRIAKKVTTIQSCTVVNTYSSDRSVIIAHDNRMFPTKGIAKKKGIKETTNSNAISSFLLGLICSNSHVTRASGKLGVSLNFRL